MELRDSLAEQVDAAVDEVLQLWPALAYALERDTGPEPVSGPRPAPTSTLPWPTVRYRRR